MDLRGESEERLIEQATRGNQAAVNELLSRYRTKALATAIGLCGNADEADDLVQDAYLGAWQNLCAFDSGRPFWPWLKQIMSNAWADKTRAVESGPWLNHYFDPRGDIRPVVVSLDGLIEGGWDIADESLDPAAAILAAEEQKEALAKLNALPSLQRQCCDLVLKGYEYQEIADILDIAYEAVRQNVSRGTRRLKEL